jgi:hypothetical protein
MALLHLEERQMIEYCHGRLQKWAEWSAIRDEGQRYMGQYRYTERIAIGRPIGSVVPLDPQCLETEGGVAYLRLEHRRLGDAVILFYRDHPEWSALVMSHAMRCSVRSLWRYLHESHALLLEYWIDRDVGIKHQTAELRRERVA